MRDREAGTVVVLRSIEDAARVLSVYPADLASPIPEAGGRRVGLALDGPPGPVLRAAWLAGVSPVRVVSGLGALLRERYRAGELALPPGWETELAGLIVELGDCDPVHRGTATGCIEGDCDSVRPCPRGCPQGMVLEVDPYDPTGKDDALPATPMGRYRCQDCDLEEAPR